jgi:RNA polymerase sigma-70 factor (ECF subfamily)
MDERELIRRAAEGDLAAFELLVERKRDRIFWIAYHVVGDQELARDVTQEVFLRLYRVLQRFRAEGHFDTWLHRIALNLSIDALRKERPHRETLPIDLQADGSSRSQDAGATPAGAAAHAVPQGSGESPAAETLRRREVRRIFVSLAALLSKKQRLAFILREIEGFSTSEVAAILRTRESTVRNHVLQARRILQEELRRRYPEYCRPTSRRDP